MKLSIDNTARAVGVVDSQLLIANGLSCVPTSTTGLEVTFERLYRDGLGAFRTKRAEYVQESFRRFFQSLGFPKAQTSVDFLVGRFESGLPKINAIVDAYNLAALETGSPIGGHDLISIGASVEISISNGSEVILPVNRKKQEALQKNELVYRSSGIIACRMGLKDQDSDIFKIHPETKSGCFMSIGNPSLARSDIEDILECTIKYLLIAFPDASFSYVSAI